MIKYTLDIRAIQVGGLVVSLFGYGFGSCLVGVIGLAIHLAGDALAIKLKI
jgi:hypothetical protein